MASTKEQQLQAFARRAARVSRALWPTNVRRTIATDRMAQTRRRLIVTCRPSTTPASTMDILGLLALVVAAASMTVLIAMRLWLLLFFFSPALSAIFMVLLIVRLRLLRQGRLKQRAGRRSFPGVPGKARFPETPMPPEPPLVRVLETFDLSQTGVEHFVDLPESGNCGDTGGYSLERWKEAQTSLPRATGE